MNRKLLALSVAAAIAAAPAVAGAQEAASSGPTVYGRLHLSINHIDNDDRSESQIASNSSRLGFKGWHDLGGGLKGIYQIESQVNADESGAELATRNTFVGLEGAFGQVRIGRFDTPMKVVGGSVDLFGDQIGDAQNIRRRAFSPDFDQREDNVIGYSTPNMGGFKAELAYSTNVDTGVPGEDDEVTTVAGALTYRTGDLYLGLGYQKYESDPQAIRLGASYKIGAVKLTGFFQKSEDDANVGDAEVYGLGASWTTGKLVLKTQVYKMEGDNDTGATMFALGADYKLAKNVTLYTTAAKVSNDDGSSLTPYRSGPELRHAPANGDDAVGVSAGIIYNF